jgi:hypothetical protein
MNRFVSPREAFLEQENTFLKNKLEYAERLIDSDKLKYIMDGDLPTVMDLSIPEQTGRVEMVLVAEGAIEEDPINYHILIRSFGDNVVNLSYFVSKNTISTSSPPYATTFAGVVADRIKQELLNLAKEESIRAYEQRRSP